MNALNSTNSCTIYLCPVQYELGVGGAGEERLASAEIKWPNVIVCRDSAETA